MTLLFLLVYFAVMIVIGVLYRKSARDLDGFVLGGRAVGPWLSAFAYGTSYFSAVIFIGYAGQFGWKYGVAATWIGIGNAFIGSLLAWVILGRRTRIMTQHFKSATMPEFFGKRFESNALKVAASVIVFLFLIPYTASLYNGLSRLFSAAFSIDYTVCIVIMAVLTGVYVIAGGYMASAVNAFIQGIIMLIGIVAIVGAMLQDHGGFLAALEALARVEDATVSTQPGAFTSFFSPDPAGLLGVVVLTSLGTWGLPQMVQKFYAIESEGAIHKGTIISTLFALIVAGGCYFLGGFGRLYDVDIAALGYDAIIPEMLSTLSPVILALAVVLVLAASMSTLSSLVIASASTLTIDVLKGHVVKNMGEKQQLGVIRALIAVFIAISAGIAIVQYQSSVTFIAQLMGVSWGALAGAFLAPFLYGLYMKRTTKAATWLSFALGAGIMSLNLVARGSFPAMLQSPINCGAFVMVLNLLLVPLVSLCTKPPREALVEEAFAHYTTLTEVPQRVALGKRR